MHLLLHILLGVALAPGSLILLAVVLWRAARAVTGFSKPPLPLRSTSGEVLCTEQDWRRHARVEFPVQYVLFDALPRTLRRIGRAVVGLFALRPTREVLLVQAFRTFQFWVGANLDLILSSIYQLDDAGPTQQELTRRAEIWSLYRWWILDRPKQRKLIQDMDLDEQEPYLLLFEEDDQLHFARLANLWRTLT